MCRLWIPSPSKEYPAQSELINPADVRKPEYFISHAWQGRFVNLVDGVLSMLRNASDDTAVWLDFMAVNQHNDTRPAINQVLHITLPPPYASLLRIDRVCHCHCVRRMWPRSSKR